jgi:hypothetical protein
MFTESTEVCFEQRNGSGGSSMNEQADYEYRTVTVDNDRGRQMRLLSKLAKQGWEILAIRPRTQFERGSDTSEATLRRIRI